MAKRRAPTARGAAKARRKPAPQKPAGRLRKEARSRGKKKVAQKRSVSRQRRGAIIQHGGLSVADVDELDDLRRELERAVGGAPPRWNADPDDVQRSVVQLVLTLVEFIRKLLERQAIRRMDAGTLTDQQVEDVGRALMLLEETIRDLAKRFGIEIEDLNLDIGPLGKLM